MQQDLITSDDVAKARSRAAAIAWGSILCGAISGLVMGLWSFDGPVPAPEWIGAYDALPRRFLRLAHVAFFALGVLHLLVARQVTASPVRPGHARLALKAMALGNVTMPAVLIGAALWTPVKFLSPLPSLALAAALSIAAASAFRQSQGAWK